MQKGKVFIITGPSGVGKSTVLKLLFEKRKNLYFSVSATTRGPRPGEKNGIDYHFLDRDTFQDWIEKDEFLEHAEFVGNFYGTPKRYVDAAVEQGQDVILDIEVQGADQIIAKRPETVRIFIAPPNWAELERRLTGRGTDSPDKVQKRLLQARKDFHAANDFDYFVINDTVENAVCEIDSIMTAEHCKPGERIAMIDAE